MKSVLKQVADRIMRLMALPFFISYLVMNPLVGTRKSFMSMMQMLSLFPGITGEWLRRGGLQWISCQPMVDCCICFGTLFSDSRIKIEDGVYIGARCEIGYARIGRDCVIGSGVHILSGKHQHMFESTDIPIRDQGGVFNQLSIGNDTWIGNGAIIGADIGHGCVIGAGSVVLDPVADYSIVAGNPARFIRFRNNSEQRCEKI